VGVGYVVTKVDVMEKMLTPAFDYLTQHRISLFIPILVIYTTFEYRKIINYRERRKSRSSIGRVNDVTGIVIWVFLLVVTVFHQIILLIDPQSLNRR